MSMNQSYEKAVDLIPRIILDENPGTQGLELLGVVAKAVNDFEQGEFYGIIKSTEDYLQARKALRALLQGRSRSGGNLGKGVKL